MQTSKMIESDGRSGPAKAGADDVQAHLQRMWAAVADSWGEHAEFIDELAAPITEKLLSLSRPRPGERVLELACGPGGLGLATAARVAPDGEVVLSDIAREMTAIAFQRAEALGPRNVTTRVLNLERIEEPDGSYDIVLCREGLMFDPIPPAPRARSGGCYGRAAASHSRSADRGIGIPGSASCSTRSAPRSGGRYHLRASRARSRSRMRRGSPRCSPKQGSRTWR